MNIKYTRHAKRRMKWRKITEKEIRDVIAKPDEIKKFFNNHKIKVLKKISRRKIHVIYAVENNQIVVITAIDKEK